jgi:replicative DNA helicase
METLADAFTSLENWRAHRSPSRSTGFPGLDEATGGFELGQAWLVTGTPGQGRSVLASQWAQRLAFDHGLSTQLVSAKDPVARVAARISASAAKVPLSHLWQSGLSGDDEDKIDRRRSTFDSVPLTFAGPGGISIADTDMKALPLPDALLVDDAHRVGGMFPRRVASLAARGVLIILTLPRTEVVSSTGINPDWAEVADFVLDIDRPDIIDQASVRPGEADLCLLRNRWGPTRPETVLFQGHYARFVTADAG